MIKHLRLGMLVVSIIFVLLKSENGYSQVALNNPSPSSNTLAVDAGVQSGSAINGFSVVVPPGINSIQPQINLQYSSNQNQDILGVGWSMDLGSIERSLKFGTPSYGSSDYFVLAQGGGQSDLVFDNIAQHYRSKIEESFMKITKVGDHWEAVDRQGTKYIFGSAANARVFDPNTPANIYKWMLDSVEDIHGNFMTITYEKDATNNQIYPRFIDYTGNRIYPTGSPLATYAQVEFTREARFTPHQTYAPGFLIKTTNRISKIIVKAGGSTQREYRVSYAQSQGSNRDLLTSIQEYDASGVSQIPATTYSYNDNQKGFVQDTQAVIPAEMRFSNQAGGASPYQDLGVRVIDLNADGYPDLVRDYVEINSSYQYNHLKQAFINNKNKTWSLNTAYNLPGICLSETSNCSAFIKEVNTVNQGKLYVDFGGIITDFNGDGVTEIYNGTFLSINRTLPQSNLSTNSPMTFSYINGWGFSVKPSLMYWREVSNTSGGSYQMQKLGNVAEDVNNDGFVDLIVSNKIDTNNSIAPLKNTYINSKGHPNGPWTRPDNDFTDFSKGATLVDLNGDNLPDIFYNNGSTVKVFMNKGNRWEEETSSPWALTTQGIGNIDNSTQYADINGDGLADMVVAKGNLANGSRVLINTGNGWVRDDAWVRDNTDFTNLGTRLIDADADTMADLMVNYNGNAPVLYRNQGKPVDLLATIKNNYGGVKTYTYGATSEFTQTFLPFPMTVIKSITKSNSLGDSFTTQYKYENGLWIPPSQYTVIDVNGQFSDAREFHGFGKVTITDHEGYITEQEYEQDYFLNGRLKKSRRISDSGTVLTESTQTWSHYNINIDDGIRFIFISSTMDCVYKTPDAKCSKTQFNYDANPILGNLKQIFYLGEVDTLGNDMGLDKFTVNTDYVNNLPQHLFGFPSLVSVKNLSGVELRRTYFSYDGQANGVAPTKGLLTKEERWAGGAPAVNPVTTYAYNTFGNLASVTDPVNNASAIPKSTVITYDTQYGIFPTQVKNVLEQTVSAAYYGIAGESQNSGGYTGLWGQTKSVNDENGKTVQYIYDSHGRTKHVISPLDSIQYPTVSYEYDFQNPDFYKSITRQRQKQGVAGTTDQYSFFDGLDRLLFNKIASSTPNQFIVSGLAKYNSKNQVTEQFLPRFSANQINQLEWPDVSDPKTRISYDALGRVTDTFNADGTRTNTAYDLWSVENYNENGHKQKTEMDAFGRIKTTTVYSGADGRFNPPYPNTNGYTAEITTQYLYDVVGNPIQIQNETSTTTITYNKLDQRESIIDPSLGTWRYGYDLNGNVTKQTDASGKVIDLTYDPLNRLKTKSDQMSLNVVYNYDEGVLTNSIGRLSEIVTNTIPSMHFKYDALGREVEETKRIESNLYTITPQYDALSNIINVDYPNQDKVAYKYNNLGQVTAVANNLTSLPADDGSSTPTPNAPALLSAVAGNGSVALTWSAGQDATSYKVRFGNAPGSYPNVTADLGNVLSYTVPNLTNGTPYYFVIVGINAAGSSLTSNVLSATPVLPAPTQKPVINSSTPGLTDVALSWSAVNLATEYKINYAKTSGGPITTISSGNQITKSITGLENSTQYYFEVFGLNASGNGPVSDRVNATTLTPPPPPAPTGLTATAGNGSVQLQWNAVTGAQSYTVKYGTVSGTYASTISSITATNKLVSPLPNGTLQYFVVTATKDGLESAPSAQVSATPTAPPAPPMTIAQDTSSIIQSTNKSSLSLNHTVNNTGSNRVLVVSVSLNRSTTNPSTTNMTYGGQILTLIDRQISVSGTNYYVSELWYLLNPPTGTNAVNAIFDSSVSKIVLTSVSLTGVKQQAPEAVAKAGGNSISASVGITTFSSGAWVIDSAFANVGIDSWLTPSAGQTLIKKLATGSSSVGGASYKMIQPAGATTMSWVITFAKPWSIVAAAFAPAPGQSASLNVEPVIDVAAVQQIIRPNTLMTLLGNVADWILGVADAHAGTLESPWVNADVGAVASAGNAGYDAATQTFTVNGSGADIWSSADEFQYVYRPITGDVEIIAKVESLTNTNSWAKAGVMIRETLNNNAKNFLMTMSPGNGSSFQRRTTIGGSTSINSSSATIPYWIKLKRQGNVFSGYKSLDGVNWIQVGSNTTVTMTSQVYVGLAVTSHNDGVLTTAVFKNVSVSGSQAPVNQAPVVNAGIDQAITLPSTATLNGTASDDGLPAPANLTSAWSWVSGPGTVTFGNMNQLATTATFSTAGTYVLRLSANDGLLSATDDVTVTVNVAGPNQIPTVNAGNDQILTLPNTVATLSGTANDDGLPNPPGALTYSWNRVSGPGSVSYFNKNKLDASVTFDTAGTHVIRLTVSDGSLSASDDLTVTVNPVPAPTGEPVITSSSSTTSSISLQWSAVSGGTGYRVKYSQFPGGPYTLIQDAGNALNATISGLNAATTYYFIVVGYNGATEGTPSVQYSATAQPAASVVATPTLNQVLSGNTFVHLSWGQVPGISNYQIKYINYVGAALQTSTANVSNQTSKTITGLTNGGAYVFSVIAIDSGNNQSNPSNQITIVPQVNSLSSPATPNASVNQNEISLSWSGVAGATGYLIRYGTVSNGPYTNMVDVGSNTTHTFKYLNFNTTYYFVVAAYNATTISNNSTQKSAAVGAPPTTISPTQLLSAVPSGSGSVTLKWNKVIGASSYNIKYNIDGSLSTVNQGAGNSDTYQVVNLTNDVLYNFYVTAVNAVTESTPSNILDATPYNPLPISGQPVISNSNVGIGSVHLEWSSMTNAADYVVRYGLTSGANTFEKYSNGAASIDIGSLAFSTTYYLTVTALNSSYQSQPSAEKVLTTLANTVPAAPVLNPPDSVGSGRVGLSWSAVPGATGYTVKYGTVNGVHDQVFNAGTATSVFVEPLTNGTLYYFVVVATNVNGSSLPSNQVTATPQVAGGQVYVQSVKYNEAGQKTLVKYGNGVTTEYAYYPANYRLRRIHSVNASNQELQDLNYVYDGVGNITKITDALTGNVQDFTYDALGRMTTALSNSYGQKNYQYDVQGNIGSKDSGIYSYGASAPLHAVTNISGGPSFTYDANGNTQFKTEGSVQTEYIYDAENQLIKVKKAGATIADYKYDDSGERTYKKAGNQTTHYVFPFYEKVGVVESDYVVMDGVRIAKRQNGVTTYFLPDHLGSDHVVADSTGASIAVNNYLPFGEFPATPPAGASGPRYTGQYYDEETGLYYYGARYYNPQVGRFLTPDSIIGNPADAQSFNRYSYVQNNPVNFVDPSGNTYYPANDQPRYVDYNPSWNSSPNQNLGTIYVTAPAQTSTYNPALDSVKFNAVQQTISNVGSYITNPDNVTNFLNGVEDTSIAMMANPTLDGMPQVPLDQGAGVIGFGAAKITKFVAGLAFTKRIKPVVSFAEKQLQKKFMHAEDFGVIGKFNKNNLEAFKDALTKHVNSPNVKTFSGTYRGNNVIFHVDPVSGLNVLTNKSGNFISGWKLDADQLRNVLQRGKL